MLWALVYVGLGSIGNSVRAKRRWPMVFGVVFIGFIQGFGYYLHFLTIEKGVTNVSGSIDRLQYPVPYYSDEGELEFKYATWVSPSNPDSAYDVAVIHVSLVLTCCVIAVQSALIFGPSIQKWFCQHSAMAAHFVTPGSIKVETGIKQAAARKINTVVRNARALHRTDPGKQGASFGQALVNFSLQENSFEEAGGILWTWKGLYSGELFNVEGIWISARIWAGNVAQFSLTVFILTFGISVSHRLADKWREGKESNDLLLHALNWFLGTEMNVTDATLATNKSTEQWVDALQNFTSSRGCDETISENFADFVGSLRFDAINEVVNVYTKSLYPESKYMITVPLAAATMVAFLVALILFATYIPSITSTTLKLRCGVIPFFHDKRNQVELRSGMAQVTMLLGSMFWGFLISVLLISFGIALVVFLIVWQATGSRVVGLIIQLFGLAITFSIKFLVIYFGLSGTVYAAYYRKKPTQGNFVSLLLEAANIAFTLFTAIVRAAKLIIICILYVGRLDTPLLAPGVGLGPIGDDYPALFQRDILLHEAHRHPYIEVLGTMYMMKLRYRELFAERAGYCFRLMFVVALMPWIRKYRILASPKSAGGDTKTNNEVLQGKDELKSQMHGFEAENEKLRVENERLRAENILLRKGVGTGSGDGQEIEMSYE